jgi:hypothetical protein
MMHGVNWYSIDSKSCFQEKSVSAGVLGSGMNHPGGDVFFEKDSCDNDTEISQMVLLKFINEFS